ncbi:Uncharacterised protein [Candidatus Anstonella stagnisolia]|nr:Uncharacterised protein [Candidatus Anstonella stagnisolia]
MNTKKGQYFSFDAIMSALILVIAVSMLSSYWFGAQNAPSLQEDRMQRRALAISDALLTSGNPPDWSVNATVFGLANEQGSSLSARKIIEYAAYLQNEGNYNTTCNSYSVPNFFVGIAPINTGVGHTLGREAPADAAAQAQVVRVATLDGQIVKVQVVVWAAKQAQ